MEKLNIIEGQAYNNMLDIAKNLSEYRSIFVGCCKEKFWENLQIVAQETMMLRWLEKAIFIILLVYTEKVHTDKIVSFSDIDFYYIKSRLQSLDIEDTVSKDIYHLIEAFTLQFPEIDKIELFSLFAKNVQSSYNMDDAENKREDPPMLFNPLQTILRNSIHHFLFSLSSMGLNSDKLLEDSNEHLAEQVTTIMSARFGMNVIWHTLTMLPISITKENRTYEILNKASIFSNNILQQFRAASNATEAINILIDSLLSLWHISCEEKIAFMKFLLEFLSAVRQTLIYDFCVNSLSPSTYAEFCRITGLQKPTKFTDQDSLLCEKWIVKIISTMNIVLFLHMITNQTRRPSLFVKYLKLFFRTDTNIKPFAYKECICILLNDLNHPDTQNLINVWRDQEYAKIDMKHVQQTQYFIFSIINKIAKKAYNKNLEHTK